MTTPASLVEQRRRGAGRVEPARDDLVEQVLELGVLARAPPRGAGACARCAIASTSLRRLRRRRSASVPSRDDVRAVLVERSTSSVDALAARGLGLDDRHAPARGSRGARGASDSTPRISRTIVSVSGWSALLTTITSGISITPGLQRLDRVARAGHQHEHDRVGVVDDVDLGLADADGLEEHVVACPAASISSAACSAASDEPAERAAVGHRADEDARVEEVLGQADAVAEQRALGERRGGVDRQHGDRRARPRGAALVSAPISVDLPTPGGPVKPTTAALPGVRVDLAHELPARGVVVLDERDRARQRALVAGEQALGEVGVGRPSGASSQARHCDPCVAMAPVARRPPRVAAARRRTSAASPPPLPRRPARAAALHARARDAHAQATRGCSCGWRG